MAVTEGLMSAAWQVCFLGYQEARPSRRIALELVKIGIPAPRAQSMAKEAARGRFVWGGVNVPLSVQQTSRSEQKSEVKWQVV